MRKPPPLSAIAKYPVTGGIGLLAIGTSLALFTGHSVAPFTTSAIHLYDQPWRLVTSIFPHVNVWHLAFNVYWLWVFGTLLEEQLGHFRLLLIVLVLAIFSELAELAVFVGGVGLSGVGYGLFGLLCVLNWRDPKFAGAIDRRTIQWFVGWFFLCIVLTQSHLMPIANVAHAAGAILGAAIGWILISRNARRITAVATTLALVLAISLGSTIFRPDVNFSDAAGTEYVNAACSLLAAKQPEQAIPLLNTAIRFRDNTAYAWYNLGVAYSDLNQHKQALACYDQAVQRLPSNVEFRKAMEETADYLKNIEAGPSASTSTSAPG